MRRNALLVVLSLSLAVPCSSALAQSRAKGRKKDQPRVLKEGDEVRVWLDPAEILRDPNLEKSGVLTSRSLVFPACRQPTPVPNTRDYDFDLETRGLYREAVRVGDRGGIEKLLREGRAASVPVETRLLITIRDEVHCRGRVTEGELSGRVIELPIKYLR